jgi:hypothetical protein
VDPPGVVWQGSERLGLRDIAGLLAPALWFSADEPLLGEGQPPIPAAHPCDAGDDHPVVYYQVIRLTYRGETPIGRPEVDDDAFADKVGGFGVSAGTSTISRPPSSKCGWTARAAAGTRTS